MQNNRPPSVILTNCDLNNPSPTASPSSPSYRRKKKAVVKVSPEQIINQAHQQLLNYIDNIEDEVKKVVKDNQSEFFHAYRNHYKTVREQMKQIQRRTIDSLNNNQHYLDKIQGLLKQVVLFRQESLKLTEKNNQQNQEIQKLKFQVRRLTEDNKSIKNQWASSLKESKEAAVILEECKQKMSNREEGWHLSSLQSAQKSNMLAKQVRPFVMSVSSRHRKLNLGIESSKKAKGIIEKPHKEERIFRSDNNNFMTLNNTNRMVQFQQETQTQRPDHNNSRKGRFSFHQKVSKTIRISTQKLVRQEVNRIKSQEFVNKTQYRNIFANCLEEVRKQIMRKNGNNGLNYFKDHGVKSFAQFKKADYHLLLHLFLKNQKIIKKVYSLLFEQEE